MKFPTNLSASKKFDQKPLSYKKKTLLTTLLRKAVTENNFLRAKP
jgi:hypothetical protein